MDPLGQIEIVVDDRIEGLVVVERQAANVDENDHIAANYAIQGLPLKTYDRKGFNISQRFSTNGKSSSTKEVVISLRPEVVILIGTRNMGNEMAPFRSTYFLSGEIFQTSGPKATSNFADFLLF